MPDNMSPERGRLLGELLTEVLEVNGGYIPNPAYKPLQKLVSWAAVEVLIVRKGGHEALLRYRSDPPWNGWHVPGGYVGPQESIQAFCNRVAEEDAKVTSGVFNIKQIMTSKWLDHPFTWPFCAFVTCEVAEPIREREDLKFFDAKDFPLGEMLHPKHVLYLETYRRYLDSPWDSCPIIGETLAQFASVPTPAR